MAPGLLGAWLSHEDVTIRITEVEAYEGSQDPASHAHGGPTDRNRVMFGPSGHLYCYLSYGVHTCVNVTVDADGAPGAVLLRGGEVISGMEQARQRGSRRTDRDLARGPGRLGQVLGLSLAHDGTDLRDGAVRLTIAEDAPLLSIRSGPRVGVSRAAERPWRFWIADDPTVSVYRRSPRAPDTSA